MTFGLPAGLIETLAQERSESSPGERIGIVVVEEQADAWEEKGTGGRLRQRAGDNACVTG